MSDGLPPLREVVAAHGLAPKKSLGQNFIFDLNLTGRIARAAGPLDGIRVIEVGPGPGGLTRALLAAGAEVVALERDPRCLAALAEVAAAYPGRLEVLEADATATDFAALADPTRPVRVCANLPYNVATPLLVGWLESEPWPPWFDRLTLMFQREVALRIVASPAERAAYGRLAVLANWRCTTRILFDVAPSAFVPPPAVTSSVVELGTPPGAAPLPRRGAVGRHPGRLRPAPQDAAAEPAGARRRPAGPAGGRRSRADPPGRGNPHRGLRRPRPRLRRARLRSMTLHGREAYVKALIQLAYRRRACCGTLTKMPTKVRVP